jgi:SAM-dependent methyltransferase
MLRPDLHEANRRSWNVATLAHNRHKLDQAAFLRGGGSTLFPEELELLGDVRGLRLAHLLCNSGQDTLGLARLGARVTGVDISDEAVDFARGLAAATGLPARFERADVYDWLSAAAPATFDAAFCSYGALCWLSDLPRFARGVAALLRPAGRFACVEFHPLATALDELGRPLRPDARDGEALVWQDGVGDYVGGSGGALSPSGHVDAREPYGNPHPAYEFVHAVDDVVGAFLGAGFALRTRREWAHANGCRLFRDMRELPGRCWAPGDSLPRVPLMYGLVLERE